EEMHGDEPGEAGGQGRLDHRDGNASPTTQSPPEVLTKARPGRGRDRHAGGSPSAEINAVQVSALYDFNIQSAMARPISSGESSWTKWSPATVTSVCAGNPRAKARFAPPPTSNPGSAFTNSLGTSLVASQSA